MKNEDEKVRDARIQELLNESDSDDDLDNIKERISTGMTVYSQHLQSNLYKNNDSKDDAHQFKEELIGSNKIVDDLLKEEDSDDDEEIGQLLSKIPNIEKEKKIEPSASLNEALEEKKIVKNNFEGEIKEQKEISKEEEESDDYSKLSNIEIIDIIENKIRILPKKVEIITIAEQLKKTKGIRTNSNKFNYESNQVLQNNFYKNMNISKCTPSSILCRNGRIFIGSNEGVIRIFSDNKENLEISNPIINSDVERQSVTCLDFDIIGKRQFLIAGFVNGSIMVYNLKEGKCIELLKKKHTSQVLYIKMLRRSKYLFISSDVEGTTFFYTEEKGFFGSFSYNAEVFPIKNLITCIAPYTPDLIYKNKLDSLPLLALATSDSIYFVSIQNEIAILDKIKNWNNIEHSKLSLSWGKGALPENLENQNSILAMAWDKVVQLVEVKLSEAGKLILNYNGFYISNSFNIEFVYWLSYNVLFLYNNSREAKLIYTGKMNEGEYKEANKKNQELEKINYDPENSSELSSGQPFFFADEIEFTRTSLMKENRVMAIDFKFYHNSIAANDNYLYIICKPKSGNEKLYNFNKYTLVTWDEFITKMENEGDWLESLVTSLDIYNGKVKGFAGIHENKLLREEMLKAMLKDFLLNCYDKKAELLEKSREKGFKVEFGFIIEFAIKIHAIDFIFTTLFKKFSDSNNESTFYETIGQFITAGFFLNEQLEDEYIEIPIQKVMDRENKDKVEKIILNLNLEQYGGKLLQDYCLKEKFYSSLIYVMTVKDDLSIINNYNFLLDKLMEEFRTKIDPRVDLIKFNASKLPLLENSKTYFGNKIFWFLNLIFNGQLYPRRGNADRMMSKKTKLPIIHLVINWFYESKNLTELMRFNVQSTFDLCNKIFDDQSISQYITNASKQEKAYKVLNYQEILRKIQMCIEKLEGIVEDSKKNDPFKIADEKKIIFTQFFSFFLATISKYKFVEIINDQCKKAAKFILQNKKGFYLPESSELHNDSENIEQRLLNMLIRCKSLNLKDIQELISIADLSGYYEVKAYLNESLGDLDKALDAYIASPNKQTRAKVFPWLYKINQQYSNNEEELEKFKKSIFEKIPQLALIDMEQLEHLVDNWFQNSHEQVINKLEGSDKLQLNYIQQIIKDKEQSIKELMLSDESSVKESEEYQRYFSLLIKHVELLCKHNKREVLSSIKGKKFYPISNCIQICKTYRIHEATAYLLKKTGSYMESLQEYLHLMQITLNSKNDEEMDFELNLNNNEKKSPKEEFKGFFDESIKVCGKHAITSSDAENDNLLWYILLGKLYEIWRNFVKNKEVGVENKEIQKIENVDIQTVSNCIRLLLEEMCKTIPLQIVLKKITEKYGELEIDKFKNVFLSMLSSFFYQEKILETAKSIFGNNISSAFSTLIQLMNKSLILENGRCQNCHESINQGRDPKIQMFMCNHYFHLKCLEDNAICPICTKKIEIEECVMSIHNPSLQKNKMNKPEIKKDEAKKENLDNLEEEEGEESNEKKQPDSIAKIDELMRKLKKYDKGLTKSYALILDKTVKIRHRMAH